MKKSSIAIWAVIVVIIVIGVVYATSVKQSAVPAQPVTTDAAATVPPATPGPATAPTASVGISSFKFLPATLTVKRGTTVTWTNADSAPHTVTGDNGGPASGTLAKGATYSYTFDTVGTFPYHCTVHPMMKATVVVN